jgi:endo-1,4-beta-xylanase
LVEGITWWDISDGGWLNAPAGLIRKDGTSKPAYDELMKLVKGEWWLTPTRLRTDENGQIHFSGFLGDYALTYPGHRKSFAVRRETAPAIEIQL